MVSLYVPQEGGHQSVVVLAGYLNEHGEEVNWKVCQAQFQT
jgi:hypothetical protein